jgi:hypothetical protein
MQCSRRCEHEDDAGRLLGKKYGGGAHQWGSGADEVADGATFLRGRRRSGELRRQWRGSEEDGMVGVVALQPNSSEGMVPGARAPFGWGCSVKEGGARAAGVWSRKERGDGAVMAALIAA